MVKLSMSNVENDGETAKNILFLFRVPKTRPPLALAKPPGISQIPGVSPHAAGMEFRPGP